MLFDLILFNYIQTFHCLQSHFLNQLLTIIPNMRPKNKLLKSSEKLQLKSLKSLSKNKNTFKIYKKKDQMSVERKKILSPKNFKTFANFNKQAVNKNIGFEYLLNVWCKNQQIIKQLAQLRIKKNINLVDLQRQSKQAKNLYILSLLQEFTQMYVMYMKKIKNPQCEWYILSKAVNSKNIQENFNNLYAPIKFKFISTLNSFSNFVNKKRFNVGIQSRQFKQQITESSILSKFKKIFDLQTIQSQYLSISKRSLSNLKCLQTNCVYLLTWKQLDEIYKKYYKNSYQNCVIFLDDMCISQILVLLSKQKFIFVKLQNQKNFLQRFNLKDFQNKNVTEILNKSKSLYQKIQLQWQKIATVSKIIQQKQINSIMIILVQFTSEQKQKIRQQTLLLSENCQNVHFFYCQQYHSNFIFNQMFRFVVTLKQKNYHFRQSCKHFYQVQLSNIECVNSQLMRLIQQKVRIIKLYQNKTKILKHVALYSIQSQDQERSKFVLQLQQLSGLSSLNTICNNIYQVVKTTKNKLNVIFGDIQTEKKKLFNQFFIISKEHSIKACLKSHQELIQLIQKAYFKFFLQKSTENQITFVNIFQIQGLSSKLQLQKQNFKEFSIAEFMNCMREIKQKQTPQTIFFMIFDMVNFLEDFQSDIQSIRLNTGAKIQIYLKYGQDFIYRPQNGSYRFIKFSQLKTKINQLVKNVNLPPAISQSYLKAENQKLNNLSLSSIRGCMISSTIKQKSLLQASTNQIDQTKTQCIKQIEIKQSCPADLNKNQEQNVFKKAGIQVFICVHRSLRCHLLQNRSVQPYNLLAYNHPQEVFMLVPFIKDTEFLIIMVKKQSNTTLQKYKQKYSSKQNVKVIQLANYQQRQIKKQIDFLIHQFNLKPSMPSIKNRMKQTPLIIYQQKISNQNQLGPKYSQLKKNKSISHLKDLSLSYKMTQRIKSKQNLLKSKNSAKQNKKISLVQSMTSIMSGLSNEDMQGLQIQNDREQYNYATKGQSQTNIHDLNYLQNTINFKKIQKNQNKYKKAIRVLNSKLKTFQANTQILGLNEFIKLKQFYRVKDNAKLFYFGDKSCLTMKELEGAEYIPSVKILLLIYLNPAYQIHEQLSVQINFSKLFILCQMLRIKQKLSKMMSIQSTKRITMHENQSRTSKKKIKIKVLCYQVCHQFAKQKVNSYFQSKEDLINQLWQSLFQFNFTIIIVTQSFFKQFKHFIEWKQNQTSFSHIFFIVVSEKNIKTVFFDKNLVFCVKQKVFQDLFHIIKRIQQKNLYESCKITENFINKVQKSISMIKPDSQNTICGSNIVSSSKKYIYEEVLRPTDLSINILYQKPSKNKQTCPQITQQNLYIFLNETFIKKGYQSDICVKNKQKDILEVYSSNMLDRFKSEINTILKQNKQINVENTQLIESFNQNYESETGEQACQIIVLCHNEDYQYIQQFSCLKNNSYLIRINNLGQILNFRSAFPWFLIVPAEWSFLKIQNGIMIDYSRQQFQRKLGIFVNNYRNRLFKQNNM